MNAKFLFFILVAAPILSDVTYAQENATARKLINSQGCKACHALAGDGGTLSVSFETMRQNLSQDEIRAKLVNPEKQHGNAKI
nr:hypothetical protein [Gammaproteobacteria bacterium]NIR25717.1 hypothetical protein [Gammaproteobacteria bacterium]NIY19031.1 hypothetical protein [Gammaproteobacteria bacterium]